MRRRDFIMFVGGAAAAGPFAATAQEPGRMYRLGCLEPVPRDWPAFVDFLDDVRRRGFIEGQNLTIDYRNYGPNIDLVWQYAAELVKARPDVIIAVGDPAIGAAQRATKTIPILGYTDDMLGSGWVDSMARPNGNTTGISLLATELDGKRQEILAEAVPGLRQMAALADSNTTAVAKLDALREAARTRNIELSVHRIAKGEEIGAAIDAAKGSGATALNVLASPILFFNRQLIMDHVAALRMPAIYQWPETAEEGGFAGYGPGIIQIQREIVARQLVQLFHGIKPADIPVEQPTKFELVINLKTAKALGLTVPESLLVRADKLIE
jgi:putative tryptophan/tyrosine transport system substrate-binding protein